MDRQNVLRLLMVGLLFSLSLMGIAGHFNEFDVALLFGASSIVLAMTWLFMSYWVEATWPNYLAKLAKNKSSAHQHPKADVKDDR